MNSVDTGALEALRDKLPTAEARSVLKATTGVFVFKKPEIAQLPPDEAAKAAENLKLSKAAAEEAIMASVQLIREAEGIQHDTAAASLKKQVVNEINRATGHNRDLGTHCALFYIEQLVQTCWVLPEGTDPHWVRQIIDAALAVRLIQHSQNGEFQIMNRRFDLTEDFSIVKRAEDVVLSIKELGDQTKNISQKQFQERLNQARTLITTPLTFEELCAGKPGQIEIEVPRGGDYPSGFLFLSSDGAKALLVAAVGGIYHYAKEMVNKTYLLVSSIGHRVPDNLPEPVKELSYWVYLGTKSQTEKVRQQKGEIKQAAEIELQRAQMSVKATVPVGEFFAKPGAKSGLVFLDVRRPLTWTKDKKKRDQNRGMVFTDVFCLAEVRKDNGKAQIRLVEFPERLRKGLFEEVSQGGWLSLPSGEKKWVGLGPLTAILYAAEAELKKQTVVVPEPAPEPAEPVNEPAEPEQSAPVAALQSEPAPAEPVSEPATTPKTEPAVAPEQPETPVMVSSEPAVEPEQPAPAAPVVLPMAEELKGIPLGAEELNELLQYDLSSNAQTLLGLVTGKMKTNIRPTGWDLLRKELIAGRKAKAEEAGLAELRAAGLID